MMFEIFVELDHIFSLKKGSILAVNVTREHGKGSLLVQKESVC